MRCPPTHPAKLAPGAVSFPVECVRWPSGHTLGLPAPHTVGSPWGLPSVTEPSEVKVVLFPGKAGLHPASQPSRVGQ